MLFCTLSCRKKQKIMLILPRLAEILEQTIDSRKQFTAWAVSQQPSNSKSMKHSMKWPASTVIIFCPFTKMLINFCKQLENINSVPNQVFKGFPQISIPLLNSAIVGNVEFSRFGRKVLKLR